VALALPATVLALAVATRALARWLRPAGAAVLVAAVAVACVPDAPAALWSALRPVTYGPGWAEVDRIVAGEPGDVLVLPAGSFRSTPLWAGGAPVLYPAPRLLDARGLVPGDLLVGGAGGVAGEGSRARAATDALLDGADPAVLAGLGVRWVLDERTSAGPRGGAAAAPGTDDRRVVRPRPDPPRHRRRRPAGAPARLAGRPGGGPRCARGVDAGRVRRGPGRDSRRASGADAGSGAQAAEGPWPGPVTTPPSRRPSPAARRTSPIAAAVAGHESRAALRRAAPPRRARAASSARSPRVASAMASTPSTRSPVSPSSIESRNPAAWWYPTVGTACCPAS